MSPANPNDPFIDPCAAIESHPTFVMPASGRRAAWVRYSLLAMFHNETWGGEKVFQLMAKLAENPAANRDLLELIYAALCLGFQGRYRVVEGGSAQLEAVRERLAQILRKER